MRDWPEKLLDIPSVCNDTHMLRQALADLAQQFGFETFAFVSLRPGQDYACSNYPTEWQTLYQNLGYRQIDPIIRKAQRIRRAFSWSMEEYRRHASREERRFLAHAAEFGVLSGLSIPVATPNGFMSMLTFASSKAQPIAAGDLDMIATASAVAQLHVRFEQMNEAPSRGTAFFLSAKEARYLQWLTLGKTVEDAADLEGVKYNTVRIALAEARRRYDLCNNTQLVALAIRQGLI